MSFKIIPFVKSSDGWTLSDIELLGIYYKMLKHRLVNRVFIQGEADTAEKFLSVIKNPRNAVNIVINPDGECLVLSWLNKWGFNNAFVHHCVFPEVWGEKSVEIGKMILKYWFDMKKDNGEPILDVIMGKTPENNRLAVKFIQRMGFTIVGTIPNICYDVKSKKKIGAVFSYIQRESINGRE